MASLKNCLVALLLLLSTAVESHTLMQEADFNQVERNTIQQIRETYTAAVVEYHPVGARGDNATFILNANVAEYEAFIGKAKVQGADIVVFPEYGLTGLHASNSRDLVIQFAQTVPSVPTSQGVPEVPCLSPNSSMAIRKLSCSSRKNKIYVVVNLPEIVPCNQHDDPDCPEDGFYIYNSNVAFDRDGSVISKYHKYNLYLEPSINKPKEPMYSTFNTDFGVTFGMFICFDILFQEPAFNLVKVMNMKHLIFSTAWISELPFLTAVQTQESWSFGLDVNLLASGFNHPESGSGGSGIYAGSKGSLISKMPSTSGSYMLISEVPLAFSDLHVHNYSGDAAPHIFNRAFESRITDPVSATRMVLIHDDLSNYTYSKVLENGLNDIELCNGNLCCNFHADVELSDDGHKSPIYRFVVTDSQIKYGHTYKANIQVCGLLYCKGNEVTKCVYYPDDPQSLDTVNFKSIRISGNFPARQLILPNTLITSLEPLPTSSLNFLTNESEITLQSEKNIQGLLTFSIYVRNFDVATSFQINSI